MPQHAKDICKKLLWAVVTILVVAVIIFTLMYFAPGLIIDGPAPRYEDVVMFFEWHENLSWFNRVIRFVGCGNAMWDYWFYNVRPAR